MKKQPVKYSLIPKNPSKGLREIFISSWINSGNNTLGSTKYTKWELAKALGYNIDTYRSEFHKLVKEDKIRAKVALDRDIMEEVYLDLLFKKVDDKQEIEDQIKRRVEILAPGGGFVFSTVHNLLEETSPEKIIKIFDTVNNLI